MEKIPNWLRYILAIPFGIVVNIAFYWIVYYSNLFFSHPESLYMLIIDFIYVNFINVFVIIGAMNSMLPKHQYKFTITLSIIGCLLSLFAITFGDNEFFDYVGIIGTMIAFIMVSYMTYNDYPEEKKNTTKNILWEKKIDLDDNSLLNYQSVGTKTYSKDILINKTNNFCTKCGKEINENWNFCNYCGNKLK